MELNDYLNNCQIDDVLCFENDKLFKMLKIQEACQSVIIDILSHDLQQGLSSQPHNIQIEQVSWFKNGVDCKILRAGSNGWEKGKLKLKVTLEFCPDEPEVNEPESPLDDIRQEINKDS
jgi:KGK domain